MRKAVCFLIHLLVEADGSLFLPMWPTDSSGLPQYYDYGNIIVSFPGMVKFLVSINSLFSFFASLTFWEEMQWYGSCHVKKNLNNAFRNIFSPIRTVIFFDRKKCYDFQSYNEKEPLEVYILFGFSKAQNKTNTIKCSAVCRVNSQSLTPISKLCLIPRYLALLSFTTKNVYSFLKETRYSVFIQHISFEYNTSK